MASSAPVPGIDNGPLLAGDRAVWVNPASGRDVWALEPDGTTQPLLSVPSDDGRISTVGVTTSQSRIVAVHADTDVYGTDGTNEILTGTPDGSFQTLESWQYSRGADNCSVPSLALASDALVELNSCPDDPLSTRDLGTPGATPRRVAWQPGRLRPLAVRAAGGVAALLAVDQNPTPWPPNAYVVVVDLATGGERYRVPIRGLLGEQAPANYDVTFDIDPDGTVVIAMPDYSRDGDRPAHLYWASAAEPSAHLVPGDFSQILAISLHDGLVAARRMHDWAVVNLRGDTLEVFDTSIWGRGRLDFDGRRIVWGNTNVVHDETYPVVASASAQAPVSRSHVAQVPVLCTAAKRCSGTLELRDRKTRQRFGVGRFAITGKTRKAVHVKLGVPGRRAVSRARSVSVTAELHARASGLSIRSSRRLTLSR